MVPPMHVPRQIVNFKPAMKHDNDISIIDDMKVSIPCSLIRSFRKSTNNASFIININITVTWYLNHLLIVMVIPPYPRILLTLTEIPPSGFGQYTIYKINEKLTVKCIKVLIIHHQVSDW